MVVLLLTEATALPMADWTDDIVKNDEALDILHLAKPLTPKGQTWRNAAVCLTMTTSVMVFGTLSSVGQGVDVISTRLPIVAMIVKNAEALPVGRTATLLWLLLGLLLNMIYLSRF